MKALRALTPRGYVGPGGGRVGYVESPTEYFGTSRQVCGLWPFAAGTGAPPLRCPAAIRTLDEQHWALGSAPLVGHPIKMLEDGPPPLRVTILADDNEAYYREISDGLRRALAGLLEGQLGDVFGKDTTVSFDLHAPAVDVNISSIDGSDVALEAAVLTATWNEGFAAAEAAHVLADAGLGPGGVD